MNGFDMMRELIDYLDEWSVLSELMRYLPDDVAVDAMYYIADKHDYFFDDKEW